jgi:putative membrane protein
MTDLTMDDAEHWRRLSPLTLLLAVARLGPGAVRAIPALAAIGIAGSWHYVVPALLLLMVGSLGFAWLAWARFRWRIGDDAIVIESGVVDRQHRTIPFDRIQDVSIEQGLIARALDLAKVGFETGASADGNKGDGGLDAIDIGDAEALRTTIRAWRGSAVVSVADGAENTPADDDAELYTLPPQRLILAGLFNFSLAALAVAGAAAQWLDDFLPFDVFDPRDWMDLAREFGVDGWIAAHRWVAGVGAVAALLFVGFATGVVRTVVTNWNFRLTLGPRAFRRVRGLTTRTDVAIPLARVQAAIVATGVIRRRWGWHELRLQSLASDGGEEKDHQLVPFGQLDDIDRVMAPARFARPDDGAPWQRPPLMSQVIGVLLFMGLPVIAALTALALGYWQGVFALIAAAVIVPVSIMSAKAHRWAEIGETLYIRRGWWSPRLTILPFANVQSADLSDGPVLRRFQCVRLALGVPGESRMASHEIDAVPVALAAELRARILSARTRRA